MRYSFPATPPRPHASTFPPGADRQSFYRNALIVYAVAIFNLKPHFTQDEVYESAKAKAGRALVNADGDYENSNRVRLDNYDMGHSITVGTSLAQRVQRSGSTGSGAMRMLDREMETFLGGHSLSEEEEAYLAGFNGSNADINQCPLS